jgi:hypothetical protein
MSRPVQVFVGNPIDEPSEQAFLARLRRDLEERANVARICANFVAGRHHRQIDFLIVAEKRTVHCELKTFRAPVIGGPNGRWREILPDGNERDLDAQNPYRQAQEGTYAVSDDMRALATREPAMADPERKQFYKRIDTVICVYPSVATGSAFEPYAHVTITGYAELLTRLANDGPRVPWNEEQWDTFIRDRSLFQPDEDLAPAADKQLLDDYTRRFRHTIESGLHAYVSIMGESDAAAPTYLTPASVVLDGQPTVLTGPSGAGKTHLARHCALESTCRGEVAVWVRASEYRQGELNVLLARSVAPFTTASALNLLRAARQHGRPVTVIVDGVNECTPSLRVRLLEQLSALHLREPIRLLLTSQEKVELPEPLAGREVRFLPLDADGRHGILDSYGGGAAENYADPFSTPFEVAIVAQCAAELSGAPTRADILDAYLRRRCPSAVVRVGLRKLATMLDTQLASTVPTPVFVQLLERDGTAPEKLDQIISAPVLAVQSGYVSFVHEQFGRFLAAEGLVLAAVSGEALGQSLTEAQHQDLRAYALELERDPDRLGAAIVALADARCNADALRGDLGALARNLVLAEVTSTLEEAARGTNDERATFVPGSESGGVFSDHWETDRPLSQSQRALLAAAGECCDMPELEKSIALLLDRTDDLCLSSLETIDRSEVRNPITRLVGATYGLPWLHLNDCLPASVMVNACRHRRMHSPRRAPAPSALVRELVTNAGPKSWGRLYLACTLYGSGSTTSADWPEASELLSSAWDAGGYHLRLAALEMAENCSSLLNPVQRERMVEVLTQLESQHIFLSTALVDALAAYGQIESGRTLDDISAEIELALRADFPEADRLARGIVTKQFEDEAIVGPYFEAVDALAVDDRVRLLVMAAAGSDPGDWLTDWIIAELLKAGDPTDPAFQRTMRRFARPPAKDAVSHQDAVAAFVAAIQGCARFSPEPPTADAESAPTQAWECVGQLIFDLAGGAGANDRTERCWERLTGELRAAAIDVFYELESADRRRVTEDETAYARLLDGHRDNLRALLEWGLVNGESLTSHFSFAFRPERDQYIVRTLGTVGDDATAAVLRSYIHDDELGPAAVASIRQINETHMHH